MIGGSTARIFSDTIHSFSLSLHQLDFHFDQPTPDIFHHVDRHAVPSLFVYLIVALNSQHLVDAFIRPALQAQALPWGQAADSAIVQHSGSLSLMMVNPTTLLCGQAAGDLGGFGITVHVDEAEGTLRCPRGEGMGYFMPYPAAAGVGAVVADVDAVPFIGHLVAFPGRFFDGQSNSIQTGTATESS